MVLKQHLSITAINSEYPCARDLVHTLASRFNIRTSRLPHALVCRAPSHRASYLVETPTICLRTSCLGGDGLSAMRKQEVPIDRLAKVLFEYGCQVPLDPGVHLVSNRVRPLSSGECCDRELGVL